MRFKNNTSFAEKQKIEQNFIPLISALAYSVLALMFLKVTVTLVPADISITLTSGNDLVIDSNKGCDEEPHAAFVAFEVCNLSTGQLNDLDVSLGNFSNASFGLAGGQLATQRISTLPVGECKTIFWYVYYDCSTDGASTHLEVTVTDTHGAAVSVSDSLITAGTISAGAGGRIVGSGISPGQNMADSIHIDVEYSVGSIKAGSPFILQPAGNLDFDASCYQLVSSEVVSSEVTGIQVGDLNKLYYDNLDKHTGNSHLMQLQFTFVVICSTPDTTNIRAYSAIYSGSNLKRYNVGNEEFSSGATLSMDWQWVSATRKASISTLKWKVGGLTTGDILTVERSEDGLPFETLDQISIGNPELTYPVFTYRDAAPYTFPNSIVYYRIKHTNQAADVSYSSLQEINNTQNKISISLNLYPNPTTDELNIDFKYFETAKSYIKLFNMQGGLIFEQTITTPRLSSYRIDLSAYEAGKYFLMVENESHRMVKAVVKIEE